MMRAESPRRSEQQLLPMSLLPLSLSLLLLSLVSLVSLSSLVASLLSLLLLLMPVPPAHSHVKTPQRAAPPLLAVPLPPFCQRLMPLLVVLQHSAKD